MTNAGRAPVQVAIVVLRRSDGRILLRRRRRDEHLPGLWEFPGGKLREGESAEEAAVREAREEMSVETIGLRLTETIEHDYPDRRVIIQVFEGTFSDQPATPDGAEWIWAEPSDLTNLAVPPANRSLVERLARQSRRDADR